VPRWSTRESLAGSTCRRVAVPVPWFGVVPQLLARRNVIAGGFPTGQGNAPDVDGVRPHRGGRRRSRAPAPAARQLTPGRRAKRCPEPVEGSRRGRALSTPAGRARRDPHRRSTPSSPPTPVAPGEPPNAGRACRALPPVEPVETFRWSSLSRPPPGPGETGLSVATSSVEHMMETVAEDR